MLDDEKVARLLEAVAMRTREDIIRRQAEIIRRAEARCFAAQCAATFFACGWIVAILWAVFSHT